MKKINTYSRKFINYFKNRSVLFYIFWLSLLVGEISLQFLFKVKGCIALPSATHPYTLPNVPQCDPMEIIFVHACIFIFLFSIAAYFFWFVFKFFRYIFRPGFNR